MRYLVQIWVEKNLMSTFPWGTFIANIAGSFIIGIVFAISEKGNLMSAEWRMFLTVGICGGFTTFSSFSHNNFNMLKDQSYFQLFGNVGGSLLFGILAVYLGIILIRTIL
jgi:CrcB protein